MNALIFSMNALFLTDEIFDYPITGIYKSIAGRNMILTAL